ncbi:MAG: DeoR/GlpR family DNA-binding transcription regulator [Lentisphaeria bacterium]|nr:DeoR/GlpR family DNA-binding transcription regulator [Lentisphaeria bacterium]
MNERKQKILAILNQGRLDIKEAAADLGVSEMTLRRDLRDLEAKQFLVQVKGGAVLCSRGFEPKDGAYQVRNIHMRIAEALLERIMPCQSVFLSAGRTAFALAKLLMTGRAGRIKVITNSLSTAAVLFHSQCQVILLGGELRSNSLDLIVTSAEKMLENYSVDWLISGCDAASVDDGFYTADVSLANLETKSLSIAQHVAVITESDKFGRRAFARFATLQDVDLLVTDDGLPDPAVRALRAGGVEVLQVSSRR